MEVCIGKKIKTSVTSTYIACATGKWYHSILPVLIFPIQILIERKLQTAGITANWFWMTHDFSQRAGVGHRLMCVGHL